MSQRLKPSAWKNSYTPTEKDRLIEAAWLNEHWGYGGKIHEEAASALVAALAAPSSRVVGHALYFKLFAEFANALEVAGAWGWALRTRRQHQLLLDAFLMYPPDAPTEFYLAARRNRSGSLIRLLNLPSEEKVVAALAAAMPEWTEEERRESLPDCVRQAKFLAGRYFDENAIIRSTYNRAKHGATMLHSESLTPRQFFVIAPHLDVRGPRDKARYDLPKFTVNSGQIRALESGVQIAGTMIGYLAGLAKALGEAGHLYPFRRRSASRREAAPSSASIPSGRRLGTRSRDRKREAARRQEGSTPARSAPPADDGSHR